MATTTATTLSQKLSNEEIIKQLSDNTDLKSLAAVLKKLQLFREKKQQSQKTKKTSLINQSPKESSPRLKLIGKKSTQKKEEGETEEKTPKDETLTTTKTGSDSENSNQSSTSKSSRRRGSRGSRRSRRRRLRKQKKLQTERAAQLLAKMVGTQTVQPIQQTLTPPQQFFKYPKLAPTRDVLMDPLTKEMRSVWSVTVPMVCHKTNTPFYAQCSTARHGYCSRCGVLRRGSKQVGSACSSQGCGERLTAKYHRWYPGLIRLEPYGNKGEKREVKDYEKHKDLFKKFNITWNSEDELNFVLENYLLMKVFLVSPDFDVAPLHVERTYMIGVFAGRKFHTGALARKFLRDGLRLMSFRADFPKSMKGMPEERSQVVEEMNQIFFQGRFRCYFHGHQSNIEGWYDPTQVDPATVSNYLQAVCSRHAQNEGGITINGSFQKISQPMQTVQQVQHIQQHVHQPRYQYPKNTNRFAFSQQPAQTFGRNIMTATTTNSSDDSSDDSTSSPTPRSTYFGQAPTVQYVPVCISNGQQFMAVPVAAPGPHGHHVAFQPYSAYSPYASYAPSSAPSDTASQTSEVYAPQGYPSYTKGASFVPFQPIYS